MKRLGWMVALALVAGLSGCRTPDGDGSETKGGISSLGTPGPAFIDVQQNVLFQEYWVGGAPHYLIANLRPDDAVIQVKPALGAPAGTPPPAGPWTVAAGQVASVDVSPLVVEPNEHGETPAVSFQLADGTSLGSLHAPAASLLAPPPSSWAYQSPLDGLGAGLAWAGVGAMTDGQPVAPGQQGVLHLVLAKGAGSVRFAPDAKSEAPQLPRAHVLSATSTTFQVTQDGDVVTIVNPANGQPLSDDRGTVDVTFEIPADSAGPMAELVGQLQLKGWSTAVSYGIPLH